MRILILILLSILTLSIWGQSINVETEKFPNIKKLTIKAFNGCCSKKGYRAVYYFDNKGNAVESSNYYKRRRLASYTYKYNNKGLLIEKTQTFDRYNKNRLDTFIYYYRYDINDRVISKTEYFGVWQVEEKYNDFDLNGNAQTVQRSFNNKTTIIKKAFDSLNRVIAIEQFIDDSLDYKEETLYNDYGDIVYSNIPTLLDKKTGKMVRILGGNRHSIKEIYEYKYDNKKRWTEQFVIFDGKKVLLEKRKIRYKPEPLTAAQIQSGVQ